MGKGFFKAYFATLVRHLRCKALPLQRSELAALPPSNPGTPLPENSDDAVLHSDQTHSEFLGRGGGIKTL